MGQVMKLANGSVEVILNPDDFEDILDKYLGSEAADYFRPFKESMAQVEALESEVEELEDKVNSLQIDLDNKQADYDRLEEQYEEQRHDDE